MSLILVNSFFVRIFGERGASRDYKVLARMLKIMPVNSITSPATNNQAFGSRHGLQGEVLALRNRIRKAETAQRVGQGKIISSGCDAIDQLLPGRGYSPGTLVQWLVPDVLVGTSQTTGVSSGEIQPGGHAADYLSLLAAIEACKDGKSLVVLDPWHQFYPPAVAALGVDMANLIILRSQSKAQVKGWEQANGDLYWAIDQSLRCSAVGAVWGPLGSIDQRWFRRFQLSAESSGCLGLFIQSAKEAKQPSWAEVQWLVGGTRARRPRRCSGDESLSNDRQQRVALRLLRCRGGKAGRSIEVGVDAVTSQVQPCGG